MLEKNLSLSRSECLWKPLVELSSYATLAGCSTHPPTHSLTSLPLSSWDERQDADINNAIVSTPQIVFNRHVPPTHTRSGFVLKILTHTLIPLFPPSLYLSLTLSPFYLSSSLFLFSSFSYLLTLFPLLFSLPPFIFFSSHSPSISSHLLFLLSHLSLSPPYLLSHI